MLDGLDALMDGNPEHPELLEPREEGNITLHFTILNF